MVEIHWTTLMIVWWGSALGGYLLGAWPWKEGDG
jgi:hypothetical protein